MERLRTAFIVVAMLAAASSAEASLDRSSGSARSRAMGGAFVSVVDDGSALFINPAGMVTIGGIGVALDYAEPPEDGVRRETRIGVHVPVRRTSVGAGWFRQSLSGDAELERFVAGAARVIASGTQGSFLAVGAGASVARSAGGEGAGADRSAESKAGVDAGVILRPLPVISIGYSIENALGARIRGTGPGAWPRVQRWGASYSWEEKVILSFEGEWSGGSRRLRYGVSVKAAAPVELMAGFSDGSGSGGIRWIGRRVRAAVSFEAGSPERVAWTGSLEIALSGPRDEEER